MKISILLSVKISILLSVKISILLRPKRVLTNPIGYKPIQDINPPIESTQRTLQRLSQVNKLFF